jgi:sulfite reductase (ferredoxin)
MLFKERSIVEMTMAGSTLESFRVLLEKHQREIFKIQKKHLELPILNTQNTSRDDSFNRWINTNTVPQKQQGYFTAFVTLGAGDITASQLRVLSAAIRDFSIERTARNTPQQNFAIRYINGKDILNFYTRLADAGLTNPGALTIASAVGCTGTTSCNLAITNSHRLAKEIEYKFLELQYDIDEDLRDSTIKISGCPNSCGQHEIATIGFFGGASRIENSMAPTYTMLFSGSTGEQGELGKTIMRVPAKRVIDILRKIIEIYRQEKSGNETLKHWIRRIVNGAGTGNIRGVEDIKRLLSPIAQLDPIDLDPESYRDYGTDIRFSAKTARGECAA